MDARDEAAALDSALRTIEDAGTGTAPIDALMAAVVLIGRRLQPRRETQSDATVPGRVRRMAARRIAAGLRPEDARLGDFAQISGEDARQDGWSSILPGRPLGLRADPPHPVAHDRIAGATLDAAALTAAEREIWRRDREELVTMTERVWETEARAESEHSRRDTAERRLQISEQLRADLERQNAALHEQLRQYEADVEAAKDELPVRLEDMPPGSPARRLVIAIRLLIAERDAKTAPLCEALKARTDEVSRLRIALEDAERGRASATADVQVARADLLEAERLLSETRQALKERTDEVLAKHSDLEQALEALRVADADRVPLRMDLDTAHERWELIQPLIRALHAWEHSETASASEEVLDEFERWQKAEARRLNGDDDEPVDVPQQPDDDASAATEERRRIVEYLRSLGIRWPGYRPAMDAAADDISHGSHVDATEARGS